MLTKITSIIIYCIMAIPLGLIGILFVLSVILCGTDIIARGT